MSLPMFFYDGQISEKVDIELDESTSKHIVQVLRMQADEPLQITNGKGLLANAVVRSPHKRKCLVSVQSTSTVSQAGAGLSLGVAFTRNTARNEWLLEKATELGVRSIIPLVTTRTQKEKFRHDRWQNILISAMLQSQQCYLPHLSEAMEFNNVLKNFNEIPAKYIAHCMEEEGKKNLASLLTAGQNTLILIGPEGDFTEEEVNLCKHEGFQSVSISAQRLRTETAAITVCAYFNVINNV